jgi:molecular chaperone DnaK (HSP70)
LPHAKRYTLKTMKDDQEDLELNIYQGEGSTSDEAEYLGTARIAPLAKGPKGSVTVEVEFSLSEECLLTVTARDLARNQLVKSVFSTRDTPAVVKARLARAERIAAAVKAAKATTSTKTQTAARAPSASWLSRLFSRLFGGGGPT